MESKTAREKFRDWQKAEGRKSSWIASKLHVTETTVCFWRTGRSKPLPVAQAAIEALTEGAVKMEDWAKARATQGETE